MKNNKLVSIILPVYNVEEYLEECFNSIVEQTYSNIEIIFVDDGSTDNSANLLDRYKEIDSRVKVFHKENGGVSSAKNTGLKYANGDYITFIDPDDYVSNDYVEYLLSLVSDNNADIAYTTKFFDNYNTTQVDEELIKVVDSDEALYQILTYQISVAVWNKIYKKDLLLNNNISFYEDIFMGEGFNFNVLAFKHAKRIATSNKKIYFYRRDNNNSATTKFKIEKWENAILAIERIKLNLDSKTNSKVKDAIKFAEWRTNVDAFTLLNTANQAKLYSDFNKKTLLVGKKYSNLALKLKPSQKDRLRAILIKFSPGLLPKLVIFRRKLYKVDVKN